MTKYELTVITRDEKEADEMAQAISDLGGTITDTKPVGNRRFTYPVKKETSGFYTSFDFTMDPKQVIQLSRRLQVTTPILRYIIITKKTARTPEPISKLSLDMSKEEREKKEVEVREAEVKEVPIEKAQEKPKPTRKTAKKEVKDEVEVVETPVTEPEEAVIPEKPEEPKEIEEAKEEIAEAPVDKKKKAKPEPATKEEAQEETEEDRLRALNEKLDELLKD